MATFRIVPLSQIKSHRPYRLIAQPQTCWCRNKGIVNVEDKGRFFLISVEKGISNDLYDKSEYGKTWGLQEVK